MTEELRELREIAPDPERMLAVRRRVLAEVAAASEPNWPLRLGWAFGLALLAVALNAYWPKAERLDLTRIELPGLPEPPAFAYEITPARPKPVLPVKPKPSLEATDIEVVESTADGMMLRLASTDPDVILYYMIENPGD
jgi:hypothetical protein